MFIHGIGIGLYQYINFLADLKARDGELDDGQVGIIAVELMSVSSRITHESLSKEAMCEEVDCIVKAHQWEKFVLVSHSYVSPRPYLNICCRVAYSQHEATEASWQLISFIRHESLTESGRFCLSTRSPFYYISQMWRITLCVSLISSHRLSSTDVLDPLDLP